MIIASVGSQLGDGLKRHEGGNVKENRSPTAPLDDPDEDQRHGYSNANGMHSPAQRLQQIAHQQIQYPAFRESFFYDETVNPVLKGDGWEPDPMSMARESRKLWSSGGRSISSRLPKTATPPGSAFRNECLSPDRLYSSSRSSLGYEVAPTKRVLALPSLATTYQKTNTPESVGPGSYNVLSRNRSVLHVPSTETSETHTERLKEWGAGPADPRQMDSAGEWKSTSEKPSPTKYSFRRAPGTSWIAQVEQRQRRSDPEARTPPSTLKSPAEQRLPNFLQGVRNPVHTKHSALTALAGESTGCSTTAAHRHSPSRSGAASSK